MEILLMPVVRMRPKGQITIPIVEIAHLSEQKKDDVISYAGLFTGAWGETPVEVETNIRNLHNEWER